MDHKENYSNLLKALSTITTKGNDTLVMANCMNFLGQCIEECEQAEREREQSAAEAVKEVETAEEGEQTTE